MRLWCRNPLKSGLLSYHAASRLESLSRRVAIPSNRGCCPTEHFCSECGGRGILSQSPQIGAAVLPFQPASAHIDETGSRRNPLKSGLLSYRYVTAVRCGHCESRNPLKSGLLSYRKCVKAKKAGRRKSQSPQIGAAVLPRSPSRGRPRRSPVAIPSNRGCCPTRRAPAGAGRAAKSGRNPLKSGLLSYRIEEVARQAEAHEVAIPSNRGCCPTQAWARVQADKERVAIPSNRGCCPTARKATGFSQPCWGRNPLKSGLLSYPNLRRSRSGTHIAVAIPSNRGCCPTAIRTADAGGGRGRRNPLKSGLLSYP